MKAIKNIYEQVLIYQIILFIIFIIEKYASLDNIPITVSILTFETTITINLYALVGILALIYGALILFGVNVLGSGLSDSSLDKLGKFIRILFIYAILIIPVNYYLQFIGLASTIIALIVFFIYFLYGLNEMGVDSES